MVFGRWYFQPKLLYCILCISLVCCGGWWKEWHHYTRIIVFCMPGIIPVLYTNILYCLLTGYKSIPELSHLQTPWKKISIWRLSNYHSPRWNRSEMRFGCMHTHTHTHITQTQSQSLTSAPQNNWVREKWSWHVRLNMKHISNAKSHIWEAGRSCSNPNIISLLPVTDHPILYPRRDLRAFEMISSPKDFWVLWVILRPHPSATLLFYMGLFQPEWRYYQC